MDGWLKGLIAAACVAIIAAVAFYFWGQAQDYSERQAREERVEGARAELFELAHAEPYETQKVRNFCGNMDKVAERLSDNDYARQIATNCRALGYD